MKQIRKYYPKFLVDGLKIGHEGKFIAIPDKGFKDAKIQVIFDNQLMTIKNWHKAKTFRRFHDKFGGTDYTLAYHEWKPDIDK